MRPIVASSWTGPLVLTLCLSIVALMTSLAALVWQIVSWRLGGPRVRVSAAYMMPIGRGMRDQNWIGVTATNRGRLQTVVSQLAFELPDKSTTFRFDGSRLPVTLPATLLPGEEVQFVYDLDDLRRSLADRAVRLQDIRPFADTGHGRVYGKPPQVRDS